jgi:CAAX protease family protein
LSLSAGFCEEIVFRGYFQRQIAAWTGSQTAAVILQGILFGILHGYQGVAACARIACFGVLYGLVATWRRSLRPGMTAHALTDVLSGIFRA